MIVFGRMKESIRDEWFHDEYRLNVWERSEEQERIETKKNWAKTELQRGERAEDDGLLEERRESLKGVRSWNTKNETVTDCNLLYYNRRQGSIITRREASGTDNEEAGSL